METKVWGKWNWEGNIVLEDQGNDGKSKEKYAESGN